MLPIRTFQCLFFFSGSLSLLPGCCTLGALPSTLPVPQSCLGQCLLGAPLKLKKSVLKNTDSCCPDALHSIQGRHAPGKLP